MKQVPKFSYATILQTVVGALLVILISAIASDHDQIRANTSAIDDNSILIQTVVGNQKEVIKLSTSINNSLIKTNTDVEWIKAELSKRDK